MRPFDFVKQQSSFAGFLREAIIEGQMYVLPGLRQRGVPAITVPLT